MKSLVVAGVLVLLAVGLALGGGVYLGLYGGIMDVVHGLQVVPMDGASIALGIVRIVVLPSISFFLAWWMGFGAVATLGAWAYGRIE